MAFLSAACTSQKQRPWLQPPAWSRGLLIGYTPFSTQVTFEVDELGNAYFFHFGGESVEDAHLEVKAITSGGTVLWEQSIDQNLRLPREPHLVFDGEALQLFWISNNVLFTMRVDLNGEILRQPQQISGQYVAYGLDVIVHPEAGVIIWFSGTRQQPGVYAFAPNDFYGSPETIDEIGTRPAVTTDSNGVLHAAWAHDPSGYEERGIYYAQFPDLKFQSNQGIRVTALIPGITSVLDGPWLGQSGDAMLVLWNLSVLTGMEAGLMTTEYVILPIEGVEEGFQQQPSMLFVPSDYHEDYRQEATIFQAGERIWLQDVDGGYSGRVHELSVVDSNASELVIALEAKVDFLRHKEEFQISLLFFQDGQPTSYQLLSFEATASRLPYLVTDDAGYLYLTWIQSTDVLGNAIFFATTEPALRESISSFDSADTFTIASDAVFGLLSGVLLIPIALVWLLIPFAAIGLTSLIRKEDEPMFGLGTLLGIVLALAAFWYGKYISLQVLDMTEYVPFSAWIPQISSQHANLLRFIVPMLIFVVSMLFAWRQTYAKQNRSVTFFVIFYALLDSLLSLAIYGLLVYGAA
jgi:hypothetical protein